MTTQKQNIIKTLVFHEVIKSNKGEKAYRRIESIDFMFNNDKQDMLPLKYYCDRDTWNEDPEDLKFYIHKRILWRNVFAQFATGYQLNRTSHEELADQLIELNEFAEKLEISTI